MSIKNISIETIGLHVGEANYARQTSQQVPYKKSGILTCGGISIFGDCSSIGGRAAVTIGTVDPVSKLPFSDSLYVLGTSKFFANMTVAASIKVTKDITVTRNVTIGGTMRAGFATWSSSIVATSKLFDIEHPSKGKGHRLAHASLEGPEIGVYYRGVLEDSQIIDLPDYWRDLVDSKTITVHLTPIGNYQYLHYTLSENKIVVRNFGNASIHCSYIVYGERKDVDRLTVEYQSDTIMEQGKPK